MWMSTEINLEPPERILYLRLDEVKLILRMDIGIYGINSTRTWITIPKE